MAFCIHIYLVQTNIFCPYAQFLKDVFPIKHFDSKQIWILFLFYEYVKHFMEDIWCLEKY